jgi:hypothetical protein
MLAPANFPLSDGFGSFVGRRKRKNNAARTFSKFAPHFVLGGQ